MSGRRKQNGGTGMVKNGGMFLLSHTIDKPIPISRKYREVDAIKEWNEIARRKYR